MWSDSWVQTIHRIFKRNILSYNNKKKEIIEFLSHCCLLVFSKIKITKVTMFLKKGLGGLRCDNSFKQKIKFKINLLEWRCGSVKKWRRKYMIPFRALVPCGSIAFYIHHIAVETSLAQIPVDLGRLSIASQSRIIHCSFSHNIERPENVTEKPQL